MATFLHTILALTAGASLHCAVRREISPCTCAPAINKIEVTCERMESMSQVVNALSERFSPDVKIWLKITHSQLMDLETYNFMDMNMNINNLRMNFVNFSSIPIQSFRNMARTEYFSLADNNLTEIPPGIFSYMPNIGTLDFARGRIKQIRSEDFKELLNLRHLVLVSNHIEFIATDAIPRNIQNLHIGRNNLSTLNGCVRNLPNLKLLFINSNNLSTLDNELPEYSTNFMMLLAQFNHLTRLPQSLKTFPNLDSLYIHDNDIVGLDGVLSHASKLQRVFAYQNKITYLAEDEFKEAEKMDELQLAHNLITSLNGSLLYMRHLRIANFSDNLIKNFSLKEVAGLRKLRHLDLSYNRIDKLGGRLDKIVESGSLLYDLRLEHNMIKSLDGALMGLNNLRFLRLSHNHLDTISSDDLIGMEELELLDLSYNRIKSMKDLSKAFLPSLEVLNASHNYLSIMEKDFHGLPVLCTADLSHNRITSLSVALVENTRCSNHGVPNKLEIYLQENPVLCDDLLPELSSAMDMYHARLSGVAHCIVPQEINIDSSVLMQPPITLNKLLTPQQIIIPRDASILLQPPSIVQIIMPSNMVKQEMLAMEQERKDIENERKDVKFVVSSPLEVDDDDDDNDELVDNPAHEIPADQAVTHDPTTNLTTATTPTVVDPVVVVTSTAPTITTPDMNKNLIHETFSPAPIEIVAPPIDRALSLSQEPEEPPEAAALEDPHITELTK